MKTSLVIFLKRFLVLAHDLIMIPLAWYLAYWLRFNLETVPVTTLTTATELLPIVIVVQMICYQLVGLYRGVWRFASIPDLFRILKAVLLAVLFTSLITFFYNRLVFIPRSVFLIYPTLLIMFLGGSRFVYRWIKDYSSAGFSGKRVLIVGASKEGEALARSFRHETKGHYKAIAFVDDDESKIGREIHGVRVVANYMNFEQALSKYTIDLVVIAAPTAKADVIRTIVAVCDQRGIAYRILPTLAQITSGQVNIAELREVALEDLLGRDTVALDWQEINKTVSHHNILVTGGGGSIGSELCRQIAKLGPGKLTIIDNSEYNLYSIEMELSNNFPHLNIITYLADVTDLVTISQIFKDEQFHMVFHAAAYKHVPLLENHVDAAVHNNILGTSNVANCALDNSVNKFVLISTDKAVNPTNAMGASKRVAEILCQDLAKQHKTEFITVRFGNVLGSRGSVIPLFRKQMQMGGPITVTHPDIERFFMTIPEASQLILQAATLGCGGEIFVLDMGKPVKITYLAEQLIKLAGKQVGKDIKIVYTGLRPGEKLFEELFHDKEKQIGTTHKKIFQSLARDIDSATLQEGYQLLIEACLKNNQEQLRHLLQRLVPEYNYSASN